jgi:hypothetical protein
VKWWRRGGGKGCEVVYKALAAGSQIGEDLGNWEVRHGAGVVKNEVDGVEIDGDDASQMALTKARYCVQCGERSAELDELAERLEDAKVGIQEGDVEMEDLVFDLEGMET